VFTVAPIVFGADKFASVLVDWERYLAPWINDIVPGSVSPAMHLVDIVEIAAGLLVALKPRYGAYVAACLGGIIVDLLTYSGYYDVALGGSGLLVGRWRWLGWRAATTHPGCGPASLGQGEAGALCLASAPHKRSRRAVRRGQGGKQGGHRIVRTEQSNDALAACRSGRRRGAARPASRYDPPGLRVGHQIGSEGARARRSSDAGPFEIGSRFRQGRRVVRPVGRRGVKLVIGIVRPEKANDVLEALYRAEGCVGSR
jgi:hypothetical protein